MEVPYHIYLAGRKRGDDDFARPANQHRTSFIDDMQVPDRLTIGECGALLAHASALDDGIQEQVASQEPAQVCVFCFVSTMNYFFCYYAHFSPSSAFIELDKLAGRRKRSDYRTQKSG